MASGRGWMRTLGGLAIRFAPCSSKEAVQSSTASDKVRPVLMTSCSDRYTYRNVSLLASIFCVCTYTKLKRTSHWRQHTITTCACKSMHTYPVAWIMDSAKRASLGARVRMHLVGVYVFIRMTYLSTWSFFLFIERYYHEDMLTYSDWSVRNVCTTEQRCHLAGTDLLQAESYLCSERACLIFNTPELELCNNLHEISDLDQLNLKAP